MNKILLLTLLGLSIVLACHNSCQCNPGSNECLRCELEYIGSNMDQCKRSCACPLGWYNAEYVDCEYIYADSQYSGGCVEGCKDFATLEEAKAACNLNPDCQAITYSFAAVGGPNAINAIGNGRGYQLRASASGSYYLPNSENTWLKGSCPQNNNANAAYNDACDFRAQQGSYLSGCAQDCKDFALLDDAQAACRADPNCGGVTFSRREIGGSAATNALDGVWGFQLRTGRTFIRSPNGENSWVKDREYLYSDGMYSGGCVQNCKDFATLDEAKKACDADPACQAVTYSFAAVGGSSATNAIPPDYTHGYQLRASNFGSQYKPNKENTWLKGGCPNPHNPKPCDFQAYQGTYLGGCAQNCKDFATLEAAQEACRADPGCGGITFSRKEIGGSAATNAFDDVWGFQLRAGTTFIQSPNGENSWLKVECPRKIHYCAKLIEGDEMDCCRIEIGKTVADIKIDTHCYFETDGESRSWVNSIVTLDLSQANLNEGCYGELHSKVQYQNPNSMIYVDLPSQYVTDKPNGGKKIRIPLIEIYDLAISSTLGPEQISQIVHLQIYIGTKAKFVRVHKWCLYVYTNRDQVQTFQIDVDIQRTAECKPGECIVIADLETVGIVYKDENFVAKRNNNSYIVGDKFYARITFKDASYTKKLSFVALYFKDDEGRVYNLSTITDRTWDGTGLRIILKLVIPSTEAVIQVNMLIDPDFRLRTLQMTSDGSEEKVVSKQFDASVLNPTKTSVAANTAKDLDEEGNKASSTILLYGLSLLSMILLL